LIQAVKRFIEINRDFNPDLIFIACGADGHLEDPLSSLRYSVEGFDQVAQILRAEYPKMPILIGGAGGYLPDTRTPEVWANFAIEIAS
jgi:acetoin utilization deacetylase AcuC-like enzyme